MEKKQRSKFHSIVTMSIQCQQDLSCMKEAFQPNLHSKAGRLSKEHIADSTSPVDKEQPIVSNLEPTAWEQSSRGAKKSSQEGIATIMFE